VAELAARRERDRRSMSGSGSATQPADCVADELACALTLTRRSAENLADSATSLAKLPATAKELRLGRIDVPKALTVIDGVAGLDQDLARAVEDNVLAKAHRQTTGELRAAVRRAVLAADPAAARQRRAAAERNARVELWDESAGTKALAGRDLPPAEVLAADKRISAIARELKNAGAGGSLDLLRAKVYVALLAGQPLDALLPAPGDTSAPAGTPLPVLWARTPWPLALITARYRSGTRARPLPPTRPVRPPGTVMTRPAEQMPVSVLMLTLGRRCLPPQRFRRVWRPGRLRLPGVISTSGGWPAR
jgi:hypothetical protein